jgi:membrane protein DedA with SNARE-associated domain/rhodanese-related sulfurtransferase
MPGTLVAFGSILAASLGVPIPALAALLYLGSLKAGLSAEAGFFAAALAGAVIGDLAWFQAGRRYGARVLRLLCRLSLSRDTCVRSTANLFARHGIRVLLVARFFPGLSTITVPLAGGSGVGIPRFLAYAETGAALWIGCGLLAGYCFAGQVDAVLLAMERFGLDVGGTAILLILAYVGVSWLRRHNLIRRLRMARIAADELAALIAAEAAPTIIDVRSALQQDEDPFVIPGAIVLRGEQPQRELMRRHLARRADHAPVVIYCACPNEASAAALAKVVRRMGLRDVRPLFGGIDAWREAGYAVEPITRAASLPAAAGSLYQTYTPPIAPAG